MKKILFILLLFIGCSNNTLEVLSPTTQTLNKTPMEQISNITSFTVKVVYTGSPKLHIKQTWSTNFVDVIMPNACIVETVETNINISFECDLTSITNESPWWGRVLEITIYINNDMKKHYDYNFASFTNANLKASFNIKEFQE